MRLSPQPPALLLSKKTNWFCWGSLKFLTSFWRLLMLVLPSSRTKGYCSTVEGTLQHSLWGQVQLTLYFHSAAHKTILLDVAGTSCIHACSASLCRQNIYGLCKTLQGRATLCSFAMMRSSVTRLTGCNKSAGSLWEKVSKWYPDYEQADLTLPAKIAE